MTYRSSRTLVPACLHWVGLLLATFVLHGCALTQRTPELGPAPADLSVTIAYLGGGRLAESPSAQPVDAEWLAAAYRRLKDMAGSMCDEQWDPTPSAECGGCDFFRVCPEGKAFIASSGRKP